MNQSLQKAGQKAVQKEISDIGLILSDFSVKAASEYFRIVPEVLEFITPDELGGWVGIGIQIAQHSSASGIRYFKEGATVFKKLPDRSMRESFIQLGLSLSRRNPSLALIYYQQAPSFLINVTADRDMLAAWASLGFQLSDYTLAVEYFKETPALLQHLPMALLSDWVGIAELFAASKLFFAITFIRISAETFSKIKGNSALLLTLIKEIADVFPDVAFSLFKDFSGILARIPIHLAQPFLEKAIQIAIFNTESAISLISNSPTILKEVGADSFLEWIDHGIHLFKSGHGKGYFTFESKAAKETANRLKGGAFLADHAIVLQRFAVGLSGRPVQIKSTTELEKSNDPVTDGQTIYLPPYIHFDQMDTAHHFEWYKIATAFQAGYLEFGTFTGDVSLDAFIDLFPRATLIQQIFDIAEGARVEFLLRQEYPGLQSAFIRMREAELSNRPSLAGLLKHQIIIEQLRQISLAGKTNFSTPDELSPILFDCCQILGAVQDRSATVDRSMKAATAVYRRLEETVLLAIPDLTGPMEAFEEKGENEQVRGKSTESGDIQPSIRGKIYSNLTKAISKPSVDSITLSAVETGDASATALAVPTLSASLRPTGEVSSPSAQEPAGAARSPGTRHNEWDCEVEEYRKGFCTVIEKTVTPTSNDFAETVLLEYGGMIKSIKRTFQYLAPSGVVFQKGELDGDQIDLDRLMENRVEAFLGRSPSERIYMRRQKRERSVALACLVDMSGSTQQGLPSGKSVLQIEKEAIVLLSHAMEAVGDRFALYGFSGRGNDAVDFYLIKDFQTRYNREVDFRIGSMMPLHQNRDGAAIRHATFRLLKEAAQTRILILLSDGKPLDDSYTRSYAIADTKRALREARQKGVHPFCITVDQAGADYLPGMYGEVGYLVVDQIETLPMKLPQIYKRLTT